MPSVSAPAKVLVTGASGFLGAHVAKALIDRGYYVRGTARSSKKGDYLKNLLGWDKFEYVIVEDMEAPNAYDQAVQGVDAVEHTASIVKFFENEHPDVIIKPAVLGTLGVLESVKKFAPAVRRIVLTSSTNAVDGPDESYWNQASVDAINKDGANAHPGLKYCASKTLAERAAWEFVEQNKGKINFDITTLCPPWIFGPMIHEGNDPQSIGLSMNYLLGGLDAKNPKTGADLTNDDPNGFVDVRDIASIHADVLAIEKAGNERYLTVSRMWNWQDAFDALNEPPAFENVPVGQPGASKARDSEPFSKKLLKDINRSQGDVFRPLSATFRDAVADAKANRDWVPAGQV